VQEQVAKLPGVEIQGEEVLDVEFQIVDTPSGTRLGMVASSSDRGLDMGNHIAERNAS
jgi:hypothetical protein